MRHDLNSSVYRFIGREEPKPVVDLENMRRYLDDDEERGRLGVFAESFKVAGECYNSSRASSQPLNGIHTVGRTVELK
jgi:hypothetical protein